MKITPADLILMVGRERAERMLGESKEVGAIPSPSGPKIRISKERKKSGAEAQYERILMAEFSVKDYVIHYEKFTFRLPHGTNYKPDFVITRMNSIYLIVEVKGAYRLGSAAGSFEKFKSVITSFPMFRFRIAQKSMGAWTHREYQSTPPP